MIAHNFTKMAIYHVNFQFYFDILIYPSILNKNKLDFYCKKMISLDNASKKKKL